MVKWSAEMDDYFRQIVPGHSGKEISQLFQERFGVALNRSQISNRKRKLNVVSGVNGGRFQKGQESWNKGKKQVDYMSQEAIRRTSETRFKPGNVSYNELPLGSEYRSYSDGIVYVKVRTGAKRFGKDGMWKQRSHIVYEQTYGIPVGDDEIVVHLNGIPDDDSPENLAIVKKKDHAILNRAYDYYDKESLDVSVGIIELKREINKRKKST